MSSVNPVAPTGSTREVQEDKEAFLGDISSIIISVAGRYSGLPKIEIAKIHENCLKLENLYKFCHLKDRENKDRDENITIEHSQMKIRKVMSTFLDFGNTIKI